MISPEDFFSDKPPVRIMGSETELNVDGEIFSGFFADMAANPRDVPESYDIVTRNGGREYGDGDLLEICTPECLGPAEMTKHEHGMRNAVGNTALRLGIKIYARTGYDGLIEAQSATAGYHENYLLPLAMVELLKKDETVRRALGSFLATRGVWTGAGIVATEQYLLTQKSDGVGSIFGGDATVHGAKSMFDVWEESSEPSGWGRLELRCTDVSMSPWTTMHKFAMTSLFLRLVEYNAITDDLIFPNPINVMDDVAADIDVAAIFVTEALSERTAIDHQLAIIEAAMKLHAAVTLPQEEIAAAKEIKSLLIELKRYAAQPTPTSIVPRRLDAFAKRRFITRKIEDSSADNTSFEAVRADLLWDEISEGYGRRFWSNPRNSIAGFSEEALRKAIAKPPHTRAKHRVRTARSGNSGMNGGDWQTIGGNRYDPYGNLFPELLA